MRKRYLSKKSFTYEIYAGTSKAVHRVFQQRGTSSIGEFPLFITCSSLLRNYGWYVFNKGCVYNQAQEGALIRGRVLI